MEFIVYFWRRRYYDFIITSNLMEDITEFFISIIQQSHSADMAEATFRQALVDDPELRKSYREYCREQGNSERRGFLDFCNEYMDGQDEMWDTLNDYNDEE